MVPTMSFVAVLAGGMIVAVAVVHTVGELAFRLFGG
jgi:hypothetical protein